MFFSNTFHNELKQVCRPSNKKRDLIFTTLLMFSLQFSGWCRVCVLGTGRIRIFFKKSSHRRVNTSERYITKSETTTVCISKVPVRKQILKKMKKCSRRGDRFGDNPCQVALLLLQELAAIWAGKLTWGCGAEAAMLAASQHNLMNRTIPSLLSPPQPHTSRHFTACGLTDFSPTRMCTKLWIIFGCETAYITAMRWS